MSAGTPPPPRNVPSVSSLRDVILTAGTGGNFGFYCINKAAGRGGAFSFLSLKYVKYLNCFACLIGDVIFKGEFCSCGSFCLS